MGNPDVSTPEEHFGRRVRAERLARLWSQAELAEKLKEHGIDLHPTAIAKIEQRDKGRPRAIRLNEAIALSKAFGVPVERLIYTDDDLIDKARQGALGAAQTLFEQATELIDRLDDLRIAINGSGRGDGRPLAIAIAHTVGIIEIASEIQHALPGGAAYDALESTLDSKVTWGSPIEEDLEYQKSAEQ